MKRKKLFLAAILLSSFMAINAGPFMAETGHGGVYVWVDVNYPWWTYTILNYSNEWIYLLQVDNPHSYIVPPDNWEVVNGDPSGWMATDWNGAIPPGGSQCCFHVYKDTDTESTDRLYMVIGTNDFVSVGTVGTPH
jgi:hypothetical protein